SACAAPILMSVLRFLMLLSLAVWLGALIFFPILAQTSFSVLPSTHLAGLVVRDSLLKLHWMGFASGVVFLASSLIYNRTLFASVVRSNHLFFQIALGCSPSLCSASVKLRARS